VTLTLDPLYLKFVPSVTLVQRYVSTKLEASTAFMLRENRIHGTDGQTEAVQHLMPSAMEGHILTYKSVGYTVLYTILYITTFYAILHYAIVYIKQSFSSPLQYLQFACGQTLERKF